MDEHCSQTLALNFGTIESVRLKLTQATKYPDGIRCAMRIQAPEGKQLIMRIEMLDIQGSQASLCQDGDYLQVFDGPTESSMTHQGLISDRYCKIKQTKKIFFIFIPLF